MPQELAPRFELGRVVITPNALHELTDEDVQACLIRHHHGDWGDLCTEDERANNRSLKNGGRLFSVYHAQDDTSFWIITEADRSVTTILLPEDY